MATHAIIKANLDKKTTPELIDILSYNQDDYNAEAIEIIRELLISRGITDEEVKAIDEKYKTIVSNIEVTGGQKRITKFNKILYWIIAMATLVLAGYAKEIISKGIDNAAIYYSKPTENETGWTQPYTDTVKKTIMSASWFKGVPEKYKAPFCDCYIGKLKEKYPLRINAELNQSIVDTIIRQCTDMVKLHIK